MSIVQNGGYFSSFITIHYGARIFGPKVMVVISYFTVFIGRFVLMTAYGFNFTGIRRVAKKV